MNRVGDSELNGVHGLVTPWGWGQVMGQKQLLSGYWSKAPKIKFERNL